MTQLTLRARIYLLLQRVLLGPWLQRFFFSEDRKANILAPRVQKGAIASTKFGFEAPAWFHASSAGELESLWPVVEAWAQSGGKLILTVFSESASASVRRLVDSLGGVSGDAVLAYGYSPWEGNWGSLLRSYRPVIFVTAKYEAWPELWMSLSELGVPLAIVGAKARGSLRFCKKILGICGVSLPRLFFLTADTKDQSPLEHEFPSALVKLTGEPRWDRVHRRCVQTQPRLAVLTSTLENLPRPWGVLGQVWREDLEIWKDHLSEIRGTLWIAPHRIQPSTIDEVMSTLKTAGLSWIRTSRLSEDSAHPGSESFAQAVILDEMGVLSELYSRAEWAYIGGGFGNGVHSTIEPAIHGIPVLAGPARSEKFAEIGILRESRQLFILEEGGLQKRSAQVDGWLKSWNLRKRDPFVAENLSGPKKRWAQEAQERLGGSGRALQVLFEACGRRGSS